MDNTTGMGMGVLYSGPTGSPTLAPYTTYSSNSTYGRVALYSGGMLMDVTQSNTWNMNYAQIELDLTGWEQIRVFFNHKSYDDEAHGFGGGSGSLNPFQGTANADGLSVSTDGTNFVPIWTPSSYESSYWYSVNLTNVDTAISQALAMSGGNGSLSTVTFRLQQYDNYQKPSDGRGWDWFTIYGTPGTPSGSPAVPEPSSMVLLGIGAIGLIGYRARRKQLQRRAA